MIEQMQRDIEAVERVLMQAFRLDSDVDAWLRLKVRLTTDRERVAIAICEAFTTPKGVLWWATDEETREKFRREADAAIAAMGEAP